MEIGPTLQKAFRTKALVALGVGLAIALFVGANAHLVYVAFSSQPACVDHIKAGESRAGQFSAAKSSC
jgi:hypothetical protein